MGMYRITIKNFNNNGNEYDLVFPCDENEYIFSAMQRMRHDSLRVGCSGGGCNVCRMRIISGDYEVRRRLAKASGSPAESIVMNMCCIQPRSDMVITQTRRLPNNVITHKRFTKKRGLLNSILGFFKRNK